MSLNKRILFFVGVIELVTGLVIFYVNYKYDISKILRELLYSLLLVGTLLDDFLESDFIGSLINMYTDNLGPVFWVFISLIFLVPLVIALGYFPL